MMVGGKQKLQARMGDQAWFLVITYRTAEVLTGSR